MIQPQDILALAHKQPIMVEQLVLMHEKEQQMPGSVQYNIRRYSKQPQWNMEDVGMMVYHFKKDNPAENHLELRFCIAGNMYCRKKETECDSCRLNTSKACEERMESVDVLSFRFSPVHLSQFVRPVKPANQLTENILGFTPQFVFFQNPPALQPYPYGAGSVAESCLYRQSGKYLYKRTNTDAVTLQYGVYAGR